MRITAREARGRAQIRSCRGEEGPRMIAGSYVDARTSRSAAGRLTCTLATMKYTQTFARWRVVGETSHGRIHVAAESGAAQAEGTPAVTAERANVLFTKCERTSAQEPSGEGDGEASTAHASGRDSTFEATGSCEASRQSTSCPSSRSGKSRARSTLGTPGAPRKSPASGRGHSGLPKVLARRIPRRALVPPPPAPALPATPLLLGSGGKFAGHVW